MVKQSNQELTVVIISIVNVVIIISNDFNYIINEANINCTNVGSYLPALYGIPKISSSKKKRKKD